jgi:hypothetical protein
MSASDLLKGNYQMNVNEIKRAGATIGAEFETGMAAVAGGLVSKLLPVVRELPKGKACTMMAQFWEQFAKNAPTYGTVARVKVTRSESLRLAAGIDAGMEVQTGGWNELLKAAPKKAGGKGAGGGRKPRVPEAKTETGKTETGAGFALAAATPTQLLRQQNAAMLAVCAAHKDGIAIALYTAVQAGAAVLAGIPADE